VRALRGAKGASSHFHFALTVTSKARNARAASALHAKRLFSFEAKAGQASSASVGTRRAPTQLEGREA
jgi:hypothetical protein